MATPGKPPRLRFTKDDHLRKTWDFREVQGRGRKVHTPNFLVVVLRRDDSSARPRLGVTVTKKVSPSAVKRNRVKRVVREVFRVNRELFPPGCDVVVIAKRGAPELGYHEALSEIDRASTALLAAGKRGRA